MTDNWPGAIQRLRHLHGELTATPKRRCQHRLDLSLLCRDSPVGGGRNGDRQRRAIDYEVARRTSEQGYSRELRSVVTITPSKAKKSPYFQPTLLRGD